MTNKAGRVALTREVARTSHRHSGAPNASPKPITLTYPVKAEWVSLILHRQCLRVTGSRFASPGMTVGVSQTARAPMSERQKPSGQRISFTAS